MEIEEVAAKTPDRSCASGLPALGLADFQARRSPSASPGRRAVQQAAALIRNLFALYLAKDCSWSRSTRW